MQPQMLHDLFSVLLRYLWSGLFHDPSGFLPRQLQQGTVADNVRDPQRRKAGLLGSKELSRTAQRQVQFGDFKSILGTHHGL
jgi:hypothetical protein